MKLDSQNSEFVKKVFSPEERHLMQLAFSTCTKCHWPPADERVLGVLLYNLEIHWRIHYWTRVKNNNGREGFVAAHAAPPILPGRFLEFAAGCARDLPYEERSNLQIHS